MDNERHSDTALIIGTLVAAQGSVIGRLGKPAIIRSKNHQCVFQFIKLLQTISVEQFDDLRSRPIIKNDIKLRINSLFPNKPLWEDTAPVRKILFSEFYRQ